MSKYAAGLIITQATAAEIRRQLHAGGYIDLTDTTLRSIAADESQRPLTGSFVESVKRAAELIGVEPRFYGCPECTINHQPADCPKLALDREIAAGMPADDPADDLAGKARAETIRMQAMQDVITRLDDLGDDSPPWLAPVIAANTAIVSVCEQVLDLYENRRTEALRDLAEHLRPLTRVGPGRAR